MPRNYVKKSGGRKYTTTFTNELENAKKAILKEHLSVRAAATKFYPSKP